MERINTNKKNKRKIFNRVMSYLFLFISVILLFYSASRIYEYINLIREEENLTNMLEELTSENERLETINSKLSDEDYASSYTKGMYQMDENGDIYKIKD